MDELKFTESGSAPFWKIHLYLDYSFCYTLKQGSCKSIIYNVIEFEEKWNTLKHPRPAKVWNKPQMAVSGYVCCLVYLNTGVTQAFFKVFH